MRPGRDRCALCQGSEPLQRSHILPEFVYRPLYDDKHTAYRFHPHTPDRSAKLQKGIWEKLLCRDCEQLLNDRYERPFKSFWFDELALAPLETRRAAVLRGIDYPSFKLFHLANLFRAAATSRGEFAEVRLVEKHEQAIRQMLLEGDPGPDHLYPIVCSAIRNVDGGVWHDLVASPDALKLHGHRGYLFTFGGCGWLYIVSSHRSKMIEELCLKEDGTMPVAKKPWLKLKRILGEK